MDRWICREGEDHDTSAVHEGGDRYWLDCATCGTSIPVTLRQAGE